MLEIQRGAIKLDCGAVGQRVAGIALGHAHFHGTGHDVPAGDVVRGGTRSGVDDEQGLSADLGDRLAARDLATQVEAGGARQVEGRGLAQRRGAVDR